jgi:hypothetical protein
MYTHPYERMYADQTHVRTPSMSIFKELSQRERIMPDNHKRNLGNAKAHAFYYFNEIYFSF